MTCPICQAKTLRDYRPFCSKRCADLDLARWFGEEYRIATDETVPEEATLNTDEPVRH